MLQEQILNRIALVFGITSGIATVISLGLEKPTIASVLFVVTAILVMYFLNSINRKNHSHPLGDFKILKQDTFLDILNGTGKEVLYRTVLKLSALRDNVTLYSHILYCSHGQISNIRVPSHKSYKNFYDEGEYKIRINMIQPLMKNDVIFVTIEATYENCFTLEEEYWMVKSFSDMEQITVSISFPSQRLPFSTNCVKKVGGKYITSEYQPILTYKSAVSVDGSLIKLDIDNAMTYDIYKLAWHW